MKKLYTIFFLFSLFSFAQTSGDLVITEIMKDPSSALDENGEWFEIYNTTSSAIDIDGWLLKDDGTNTHTINSVIGGLTVVPAGGYLVLGKKLDMLVNGGTPIDYEYLGDFNLGNGLDEIIHFGDIQPWLNPKNISSDIYFLHFSQLSALVIG